ncbi:NAD-binding protein [Methylocucumis oryzae]|uniref:NAD-binding protein n=1 Tax=Methylocucumis oryzae TaxID=1632867 RepID=UPI000B1B0D83
MRILILGAGSTGSSVAEALAGEANEITILDTDKVKLEALKTRLKINTIVGNASYPKVLEQADVHNTDLVIAVTNRDETNILACTIISKLYSRPKTIARIRAIDYLKNPKLFGQDGIPIDIVISPEQKRYGVDTQFNRTPWRFAYFGFRRWFSTVIFSESR